MKGNDRCVGESRGALLSDWIALKILDFKSMNSGHPESCPTVPTTSRLCQNATRCSPRLFGARCRVRVMLYQMLSGRLPFDSDNHQEIFRRIQQEEPASFAIYDLGFSISENNAPERDQIKNHKSRIINEPDLSTIVLRCLEKEPSRRLPSAAFLAEELERWLGGEPIRSRPVTPAERAWKWTKRHPYRVAGLTMLAASLLAGTITSLVLWRRAEATAAAASRARDEAEEDAYFATVANALSERSGFDFASARKHLADIPPERRGFEWRLIHGLSQGDDVWSVSLPKSEPRLLARDPSTGKIWLLTDDRQLHILDAATGQMEPAGAVPVDAHLKPNARFKGFHGFAFAPDGAHYFVTDGAILLIVRRETGAIVFSNNQWGDVEAAWLDASRLIFGGSCHFWVPAGRSNATIYDLQRNEAEAMPPVLMGGPFAVSPDGARIAWVRGDGGNRLIVREVAHVRDDAPDVAVLENGKRLVSGLAFSADGQSLAVAWHQWPHGIVSLYALPDGTLIAEQPVTPATQVFSGSDSTQVAIIGQDPWITLLQPVAASTQAAYDDGTPGLGDFIAAGRPLRPPVQLLTRSGQSQRHSMMFGHEAPPRSALSLSGEKGPLTAGADGSVRRWPLGSRVPSTQRLENITTLHNWFHPAASPDGLAVLCLNRSPQLWFWHRFSDRKRVTFDAGQSGLACFDDGRVLVRDANSHRIICWQTGGETPARLWEVPCGRSIMGFQHIIHSATSPDGRRVAVLMPGKLLVVDMDAHSVVETGDQVMDHGLTPGQTVAISPDGTTVAVTGFAGFRARLYQAADPNAGHEKVIPFSAVDTHDTACVFTRDGTRVFVGNEDGRVRVFDVKARRELPSESWKAHTTAVTALAVSHSGEIIATAAEGSMALWYTIAKPGQPRRQRLRIRQETARNWMHFSTGDTALLHSAPERPVEVWEARK